MRLASRSASWRPLWVGGAGILAAVVAVTSPLLAPPAGAEQGPAAAADVEVPTDAVAVLIPTAGNDVRGVVYMQRQGEAIRIRGKVINLSPGKHGFHIHQYGDLTSPDGTSAGGHYDPHGHPHGGPDDQQHHAGDLGNIEANEGGVATVDLTVQDLALHFVIGRALVVHQGEDDFKSQPSGDAGPRVALGVIGFANTESPAP